MLSYSPFSLTKTKLKMYLKGYAVLGFAALLSLASAPTTHAQKAGTAT